MIQLALEAWRLRRTAYPSGRKELVGFTKDVQNPFRRKTRTHTKERFYKRDSNIKFTPFRGMFRSRRH